MIYEVLIYDRDGDDSITAGPTFTKRHAAEEWASARSRFLPGSRVVVGGASGWVTVYADGWLKDAQKRGSYEPADQKKHHADLKLKYAAEWRARPLAERRAIRRTAREQDDRRSKLQALAGMRAANRRAPSHHRDRRALSAYQRVVYNRLRRRGMGAARAEAVVRAYHAQITAAKRQGKTTKWVASKCASAARRPA